MWPRVVRVAESRSQCQLGGLEREGAPPEPLLITPTTPPEGHDHAQGRAEAERGELVALGLPAEELGTPEPLFTFSLQQLKSQQAAARARVGEELKEPLHPAWILPILPLRVARQLRYL